MYSCVGLYRHIKITYAPSQGGVVTVSTTPKNIMPEFRMLAFKCMHVGVHFLKVAFFSKNPNLKNIQITRISKTVQKVVPNIFEINLKIN